MAVTFFIYKRHFVPHFSKNTHKLVEMEGNNVFGEKFNTYVERSLSSGIKSLEMVFTPISDCYGGAPVAISSAVQVNSVISGTISPDSYLNAPLEKELLTDISLRAIIKSALAKIELEEKSYKFKFLSVRCSNSLVYSKDLYSLLCTTLASVGTSPNRLCLEFDGSVMSVDEKVLHPAFADIRAAGLSVAVRGYGEEFSMEKLLGVCPDYLFTGDKLARLVLNREKRGAVAPIINFAKSLGSDVIACGIVRDEELYEFRSRECFGYIPDKNYKGAYADRKDFLSVEALMKEGESNV